MKHNGIVGGSNLNDGTPNVHREKIDVTSTFCTSYIFRSLF